MKEKKKRKMDPIKMRTINMENCLMKVIKSHLIMIDNI